MKQLTSDIKELNLQLKTLLGRMNDLVTLIGSEAFSSEMPSSENLKPLGKNTLRVKRRPDWLLK